MLHSLQYTIDAIRDEARHLVECGTLSRHQPIHMLCRFFPDREWCSVERELERHQYLLRDPICDLVNKEDWSYD